MSDEDGSGEERLARHDEASALAELGADLAAKGDESGAIDALSKAASLDPGSPKILYAYARALARGGRQEKAILAFDRLLVLTPEFGQAHLERGIALAELDRHEQARAAFREALRQSPDDVYALNHLALSLRRLGDQREAEALLRRAMEVAPSLEDTYQNLTGLLAAKKQWQDAEQVLRLALWHVTAKESLRRLWQSLAFILWDQDRVAESEEAFLEAIKSDPNETEAELAYGAFLAKLGRLEEANLRLTRVAARHPPSATAHCVLGTVLLRQGDPRGAVEAFQEGLRIDSNCLTQDPEWQQSYEDARRLTADS